ncbi:MAG: SulP family inorganic anion transporter [Desulfobacteraceae bacterium]|nr:MAG: SulP family inorganic anion transporter [Desulfobacteraceae bacterium]
MLAKFFPFLCWFKNYNLGVLKMDALAGLTVALVLIPQSMAYAQLAGLPPYYGLYASFLPPMIAALFGSSPQLATGPVAVVSLITAASLGPLATAGSEGYISYAILLALMVGAFQFALGVLRLGLVVNFMSHPVVNGFTNAAAIIIASSQLSKLFGVQVDKGQQHYETIYRVIKAAMHYTHWPTLLLGVTAFAIMYGIKRVWPKIPNVLVAVTIATAISWAVGFERKVTSDISAIVSPKARETITKFNSAIYSIMSLAQKNTTASEALEKARRSGGTIAMLDAKREMGIIETQIERFRYEAHAHRKTLRSFLFSGVRGPDGILSFHFLKEVPDGAKSDNRIWRIEAGNKPFRTDELVMTGGGAVVGAIPKGLPSFTMPKIDLKIIRHLLPFAAIISLLGFMEAISIAKAMSAKTGQRIDPNQELIGQGLANFLGAIGKSYPTSGSFSRSAINLQSGAISGFSSIFTGLAVVIMLLFFTPILYHLPQSVLAAVIMIAVIRLLNVSGFIHAWKAQWYDGAISIITFVSTLAFAPHLERGILIGVALSLLVFLYKSMRPTAPSLSMYVDEALHDSEAFGLKQCNYIAVVRFDGPLFFANASYLEDQITQRRMSMDKLKHIHIVANGVNDIDASGEESLSLIVDRVRSAGMDISISGVNGAVMAVLKRTHFLEKIGQDHIYPTIEKAIKAIHEETHKDGEEKTCPLLTVCRLA